MHFTPINGINFLNWDHRRKGTGTTTRTHKLKHTILRVLKQRGAKQATAATTQEFQLQDETNLYCSWCTTVSAYVGWTVGIRKTQACTRLLAVRMTQPGVGVCDC